MFSRDLRFSRRAFLSVLSTLFFFLGLTLPASAGFPNGPYPTQYYVSKNGDNSDGKSWATAWNEMDQIKWNQINVGWGDSLVIDGGSREMVYRTPMHISYSQYYPWVPLRVKVSDQANHNGRAIIYGGGQDDTGLIIGGANIQVSGTKAKGLVICGWGKDGVSMPSGNGPHCRAEFLEIYRNGGCGLHLTGGFNCVFSKSVIHDNGVNVKVDPAGALMGSFNNSWIYNSSYRYNTDGIIMGDGTNVPHVTVANCVIGPGLRRGFHVKGSESYGSSISNCLLINATRSNISTVKGLAVSKCTSFMTRSNPWRRSHACVAVRQNQTSQPLEYINSSIFYGGVVRVPAGVQYNVSNNTQFKTTGNTTFFATAQVDPMFVTNVGRFPSNVSVRRLIRANFSLQAGSPASGAGSSITSVKALLDSF